jgi:hypothetical protein
MYRHRRCIRVCPPGHPARVMQLTPSPQKILNGFG